MFIQQSGPRQDTSWTMTLGKVIARRSIHRKRDAAFRRGIPQRKSG
jgi:hypothetical protein